jgi:hypothetical protein
MAMADYSYRMKGIDADHVHYPPTWLITQNAVERGAKVGREPAPLYRMRDEDVRGRTPETARDLLGIKGVQRADTATASAQWC